MNEARFNALYAGLTSIARKVYDVTPIREEWPVSTILNELGRQGTYTSLKVVQGCLTSLVSSGLVKERGMGRFIRTTVRRPEKDVPTFKVVPQIYTSEPIQEIAVPQPTPTKSPIDALTDLMAQAEKLVNDTKALIDGIATIGSRLEEQMAKDQADLAKLRQLQGLLKDLG